MSAQNAGVITFLGYQLTHLEYDCDPNFDSSNHDNGELRFNFSKFSAHISDDTVQVNLLTRVFFGKEDTKIEDAPFSVVVEIAGLFQTLNRTPWVAAWENNAIAILFPYVRALIGSVTSQSGREPILLPTINVAAMFGETSLHNH